MEVDASIYRSPKRKRGQLSHGPSLTTSGLSRSLSPPSDLEIDNHSPSTKVTGKFRKLDLQSPIELPSPLNYNDSTKPVTTHFENVGSTDDPTKSSLSQDFEPPPSADFTFESPTVPKATLVSNSPPAFASRSSKSPPPSSVVSDQFWHASEITGWSPDDPDEDNYGINGVGYAKSTSRAWAISQKRKQQIADYRSRETREARQKRHERRLSGFNSRRGSPRGSPRPVSRNGDSTGSSSNGVADAKGVRSVRFDDG